MSYKHLTINERNKIEVLSKEGYSSRRIAKVLGFHHSTISRELKRCAGNYKAFDAQNDKVEKSSLKGRESKVDDNLRESIVEKLHRKWSPEQIANTICEGIVCFKTIYNWIYSGIIEFDISKLEEEVNQENPKKQGVGLTLVNQ